MNTNFSTKTFVPVQVEGVAYPLNIKWYYRVHCNAHGCSKHIDGSHLTDLPQFVEDVLARNWTFSTAGNFYCPKHAIAAAIDTDPPPERNRQL